MISDLGNLVGWGMAGFFLIMFFAYVIANRNATKKAQEYGEDKGWHDRQHWETDAVVKGKLERQ